MRRDEVKRLRVEVQRLTAKLAVLHIPRLTPEQVKLAELMIQQTVFVAVARCQQFQIAVAQSLLDQHMREQDWNPLYKAICLGKEWTERRATLLGLRPEKLQNAYDYITSACPLEELMPPQHSDERLETPEGDTCCAHIEVAHFAGVESVQQVFNALKFFVDNMEIIVSERLGHITLREDYDAIENVAYNARIVSRNNKGIRIENNVVGFATICGKDPCAIVVIDSVDQDALHPYVSSERVRRDISVAIVLTASENCSTSCSRELIVTMRRVTFLKLYRPEFPVSKATLQELQMDAMQWNDLMMTTIRDVLSTAP
ncbi:hypothetical protein P3T76_013816 [Phytophthora citrophthora]|uniref:Uncharacterized protein n=1 Tax=Phytophthora citrophthora TaxID=4793 RepID=A0AAD9G2L4_9STRA|nr:hypothetical protein P3T76_013816 [Phytophthora citrophthora]